MSSRSIARTIERALYEPLPERLIQMDRRHDGPGTPGVRLQGDLRETPRNRFRSFLDQMGRPENAVGLLQEYPVLARQLVESIDQWARFGLEFLRHLCTDLEAIRERFSPGADLGPLTGVSAASATRTAAVDPC